MGERVGYFGSDELGASSGAYDAGRAQLISTSKTWSCETFGINYIDKLYLDADHIWEKCEITIRGRADKYTGVMIGLIANNEIKKAPDWRKLLGADSFVYTIDNINSKTPLLVTGYITSNSPVGGGADITLTGYYYSH